MRITRFSTGWLIILSLLPALLSAQDSLSGSVTGKVIDARTIESLAGVNIVVIDSERGASTDTEGNFTIENLPPGTYQLEIEYIGYITQKVTDIIVSNSKPAVVNIKLSEQILETEDIVVTAGYFVEETMTPPSTVSLNREEIRRFPGGFEDVVRTVSTLPGVAINYTGGRNSAWYAAAVPPRIFL